MSVGLNEEPYSHVFVAAFNVEGDSRDDLKFPLNMTYRGSTNGEGFFWGGGREGVGRISHLKAAG